MGQVQTGSPCSLCGGRFSFTFRLRNAACFAFAATTVLTLSSQMQTPETASLNAAAVERPPDEASTTVALSGPELMGKGTMSLQGLSSTGQNELVTQQPRLAPTMAPGPTRSQLASERSPQGVPWAADVLRTATAEPSTRTSTVIEEQSEASLNTYEEATRSTPPPHTFEKQMEATPSLRENVAVFSLFVKTSDHHKHGRVDLLQDLVRLRCSAVCHGSEVPFVLIYGGGADAQELQKLREVGWKIVDCTGEQDFMRRIYHPVYSKVEALRQNRPWVVGDRVQQRRDGWATYFKFLAWNMTEFQKVLFVDADVEFRAKPDTALLDTERLPEFVATDEKLDRTYMGLNTHMMILTPSVDTFKSLVDRADQGKYRIFTNTEQDVLESAFAERRGKNVGFLSAAFPHLHWDSICKVPFLSSLRRPGRLSCDYLCRQCHWTPPQAAAQSSLGASTRSPPHRGGAASSQPLRPVPWYRARQQAAGVPQLQR
eukprot:TRINITY_DN58743_c0_g1_i1.p1 TRINITY_DN58743_c0_g1~~TRINITY_DN58743_c0_g1_i1.p1  ORF type:complete len:486 (+),score=63.40 TRINITY_DN58743_c0_g1_i1:97-1554(+)